MPGAADDEPVSGQPLSLVEAGRLLDEVVDVHEVLTDERVLPLLVRRWPRS